jgi:tRNA G10  N-methylase Trm11
LIEDRESDDDFWSLKDRDRRDSAHCIFQYPAMMVPLVQRRLLASILRAKPSIRSIYDPFVGSGTSLVSGMHFGLDVYGNDINPLAVLISRVRTARQTEFTIGAIVGQVAREASADKRGTIECELRNREKWFQASVSIELSRLRRAIRRQSDLWVRRFLWVTLAETVRLTSNDRTSTYKLHARPEDDIAKRNLSPISVFLEIGKVNAESFADFRSALRRHAQIKNGKYVGATEVEIADTRDAADRFSASSFDLVMTSPPYGDNLTTVTYGQHSYLPLHWIDYDDIDSVADRETLRTTHEIDRRSLGGISHEMSWIEEKLLTSSPTLKTIADNLPSAPADGRKRLLRFYSDFGASLVSIANAAKPNAYMVWTVGNRNIGGRQVPTDMILQELLEQQGCSVLKTLTRTIHHKRMPDRNASSATMREERILLVRKLDQQRDR